MSYDSQVIGRALIVEWLTSPTLMDINLLEDDVVNAYLRAGEQLVYVAFVPAALPIPEARVRGRFIKGVPLVFEHCSSLDLMLVGNELETMLMRGVMRTFATLANLRSSRNHCVFVHSNIEGLLRRLTPVLDGKHLNQVIAAAQSILERLGRRTLLARTSL